MRKAAAAFFGDPQSWRSHEPSRLETFSDAVFAFALTLIIVSLEVPRSFAELYETMKGVLSFAICFTLLFLVWNTQNKFFRQYGLKSKYITGLNAALLFVVLMYSYPLKFLFYLLLTTDAHHQIIEPRDVSKLMVIYGMGFTAIYVLFYLMYREALARASELHMTPLEYHLTQKDAGFHLINIFVGVTAIILANILPADLAGYSGFAYMLIPVSSFVWRRIMKKRPHRDV